MHVNCKNKIELVPASFYTLSDQVTSLLCSSNCTNLMLFVRFWTKSKMDGQREILWASGLSAVTWTMRTWWDKKNSMTVTLWDCDRWRPLRNVLIRRHQLYKACHIVSPLEHREDGIVNMRAEVLEIKARLLHILFVSSVSQEHIEPNYKLLVFRIH